MNHLIDPSFIRSLHNSKLAELRELAHIFNISTDGLTKTPLIQKIIDHRALNIKWNDPLVHLIAPDDTFDILPHYWDTKQEFKQNTTYHPLSEPPYIPPDTHAPFYVEFRDDGKRPHLLDIIEIYQSNTDPFIKIFGNKASIDVGLIQYYLKNNYRVPRHIIYILLQMFELSVNSIIQPSYEIYEYTNKLFIPDTFYRMPILDSPHINLQTIKMYSYQKSTVMWMNHVENLFKTECFIEASGTERAISIAGQPSIIFRNGQFFSEQCSGIIHRRVFAKGGILGHEMGIGKTACVISLIKFVKMTTHPRPCSLMTGGKNRIFLPINIIICPPHLVVQWNKEISSMAPELNSYSVLSKARWNTITPEMKQKADIIIIPYSADLITYIFPTLVTDCMVQRLIIDEGHEYIEQFVKLLTELIPQPQMLFDFYKNAWYISGTPFSKTDNMKYIFDLLHMCSEDSKVNLMSNQSIMQIMKLIYIHMTKDYVDNEINLTKLVVTNKFLTMNKVEEMEYLKILNNKHMGRNKLIMFASDIMIDGTCKSGDEIMPSVVLDINQYIEQRVSGLNSQILELENNIKSIDQILESYSDIHNSITLPFRNKRTRAINQLSEEKGLLERYHRILRTVDESQECSICLSAQESNDQKWAMCNGCLSIFCVDCFTIMCKLGNPSCPMCRSTRGVKLLTNNGGLCLPKWGTKASQMIADIKAIPKNEKIIVFSQFNELLHKLRAVLVKENISAEYMNSHIYNRNAIINRFQSDGDPQVLLLSSVNTGSGLNLTVANHIIFMDIIDTENIRDVEMVENQAIGRSFRLGQTKDITITRYIMSDTVEAEIFNQYKDYYTHYHDNRSSKK